MREIDLDYVGKQLNKRLQYPYIWSKRQDNEWDKLTDYVYRIIPFDELMLRLQHEHDTKIKGYAMNRWFNHWSAKAVEYMFAKHECVTPHWNEYDRLTDFTLFGIKFDHKTSVLPKDFDGDIRRAVQNKAQLIRWLYTNQSQGRRKHFGNRLFVIICDPNSGEHWKIKADLKLLNTAVDDYVDRFHKDNLLRMSIGANTFVSDAIFVVGGTQDQVSLAL